MEAILSKLTEEEAKTFEEEAKIADQVQYIMFIPGKYAPCGRNQFRTKYRGSSKERWQIQDQVNPQWINQYVGRKYQGLVKKRPREWWPLPIGDANDSVATPDMYTSLKVIYPQGDKPHCLFCCLASALYYCKLYKAANYMKDRACHAAILPKTQALTFMTEEMKICAPEIAQATVYNRKTRRKAARPLTIQGLLEGNCPFPTVVIPMGRDYSTTHAFCVVDDLVFDSTQTHAMKLQRDVLDWICGEQGMSSVHVAYRFDQPFGTKKKLVRDVKSNWY